MLDTWYAETVTVRVGVPSDAEASLAATVAELTAGAGQPIRVGKRRVDVTDYSRCP